MPEVPLAPGTLFVADLHLDLEDEAAVDRFLAFLHTSRDAPRLVILGDLFEYWLGRAHEETVGGRRVLEALAARAGAFHVVPGNRDFLLGESFERRANASVHPAGFVGVLPDGARVLFVHGDELATRDRSYQRFRGVIRSRPVLGLVPRLPIAVTRALARRLRRASRNAVAKKPQGDKALQPDAAAALMETHDAAALVCGHAHEFERAPCGGGEWVILDAFGGKRDALRVDLGGGDDALLGQLAVTSTAALVP